MCRYRTMNRGEADKLEAAHLHTVAVNWKENESKNVTLVGIVSDEAIWRAEHWRKHLQKIKTSFWKSEKSCGASRTCHVRSARFMFPLFHLLFHVLLSSLLAFVILQTLVYFLCVFSFLMFILSMLSLDSLNLVSLLPVSTSRKLSVHLNFAH